MASIDLWSMAFVFLLATFVGFQVIQNVSRLLHTPLMSLTNAISAIAVVGSIIIAGEQKTTCQHRARSDRGRGVDDQHRQRLPDHRPHAEDVPRAAEAADMSVMAEHLTQASYLAAGGALHPVAAVAESTPKTARRGRRGGRRRHGGRHRRHAAPPRDRHLHLDRRGGRRRHGDRRAAVAGAADRGAAADGAVARLRRPRGRPGRHREVLPLAATTGS